MPSKAQLRSAARLSVETLIGVTCTHLVHVVVLVDFYQPHGLSKTDGLTSSDLSLLFAVKMWAVPRTLLQPQSFSTAPQTPPQKSDTIAHACA